jgi:small subunit ribosomal protein S3
MGQKVCPIGLRLGIVENFRSRWYANKKEFGDLLVEDQKIRKYIAKEFRFAGIPKVEIERTANDANCIIHTARPGLIIGRKGAKVDKLRDDLAKITGKKVNINIVELASPELSAQLVAESIAEQLEKRASFRRTMKKAIDLTMQSGAKGVRVQVSGRLGGSEMARCETQMAGSIPLSTLRAKIDYGFATAVTVYGSIGVKVWIYLGEQAEEEEAKEAGHGAHAKARQAPKRAKR